MTDNGGISEKLMDLYRGCGYTRYKMSRFEEYDLYSRNMEFLPSRQIITFTDTDGRLMALKPDVTLSIVKNSRDGADTRLYYNESVFRTDGGGTFAEIQQTGLEYVGRPDPYRTAEVLMLAGMSLELISDRSVLDVSHLGILSLAANRLGLYGEERARLSSCFGSKNAAGAASLCRDEDGKRLVSTLMNMDPSPEEAFETLYGLSNGAAWDKTVGGFEEILKAVPYGGIRVDLSVVNDVNYYNGVVFQGYVQGVPFAVLSGGQYDNLMKKTGKNNSAAGFAVYLDRLDFMENEKEAYADRLILYGPGTDPALVCSAVKEAADAGMTVTAETEIPTGLKYGAVTDLRC